MVATDIYNTILKHERKLTGTNDNTFFEPFCGGFNMTKRVCTGPERKSIIVCDINPHMISLYRYIDRGWQPKNKLLYDVSESQYEKYKKNKRMNQADRTFVGLAWSKYGWLFNKYEYSDWYPHALRNELISLKPLIQMTKILDAASYDTFTPKDCVIYCDPPYSRTDVNNEFDTVSFWHRMRNWSKRNIVFVSEETAPSDFKCIWKVDIVKRSERGHTISRTDKLFIIK